MAGRVGLSVKRILTERVKGKGKATEKENIVISIVRTLVTIPTTRDPVNEWQ